MGFYACNKKEKDCFQDKYDYAFLPASVIDTATIQDTILTTNISTGASQVFQYRLMHTCPSIADAGWGKELIFEVPAGATSFNYTAADFAKIKCYYHAFPEYGLIQSRKHPLDGSIKGEKTGDNIWKLTINVQVTSAEYLQLTENFTTQ